MTWLISRGCFARVYESKISVKNISDSAQLPTNCSVAHHLAWKKSRLWLICLSTSTSHIYITSFFIFGKMHPFSIPLRVVTCFLNLNPNTAKTAQLRSSMSRKDLPSEQICQQNRKTTKQTNKQTTRKRARIVSFHSTLSWPQSNPPSWAIFFEIMQPHRSRNLKFSSQ